MNTIKNLRFTDTMHRPYNIQITISHLGKDEFSFKNIMRSGIKIHEKLFLIKKGAFLDVKISRTKMVVVIPFLLCLFGLRKHSSSRRERGPPPGRRNKSFAESWFHCYLQKFTSEGRRRQQHYYFSLFLVCQRRFEFRQKNVSFVGGVSCRDDDVSLTRDRANLHSAWIPA